MTRLVAITAISLSIITIMIASPVGFAASQKDTSRLINQPSVDITNSLGRPLNNLNQDGDTIVPPNMMPETVGYPDDGSGVDYSEFDPNDIPAIATIELTVEVAQRAINALVEVRDRYSDKGIDDYATLEEFVAKTTAGKKLQADVQRYKFSNVTDWSRAIASVGFAYGALTDNEEIGLQHQIEHLRHDKNLPVNKKKQAIANLTAMLPSSNNKAIIGDLMRDPVYMKKLQLLE